MGIKMHYSEEVNKKRVQTLADANALHDWNEGRKELNKYRDKWETVNIEDVVDPTVDLNAVKITARKVIYPSVFPGLIVIADFGGGYLRIYNPITKIYYDTEGNPVGKGETPSERRRSHFRILKWEEMKNNGK